jgi:sortase A
MKRFLSLRNFNHLLSGVVLIMALYIFVWPFSAQITWWIQHDAPVVSGLTTPKLDVEPITDTNTVIIPGINLKQEIVEGNAPSTVHRGVWRRPNSSNPTKGSNTVLVGHRFTYDGASVFYHLDKVKTGDEIIVYWNKQLYKYEVIENAVVSPENIEVEASTDEAILTLYTCTPLTTAKDRLVVKAKLVQ